MATSELRFAIKPSLYRVGTGRRRCARARSALEPARRRLAHLHRAGSRLRRRKRRADRIVATTATLPYGSRFRVDQHGAGEGEYRRHGLATQLMRRAMDELAREGRIPILDATPDGRAVYRRLGFEDSWGFQRFIRREPRTPGTATSPPADIRVRALADRRLAGTVRLRRRGLRRRARRRCWPACAGDCPPPSSSPSARAASPASCSAATAC